MARTLRTQLQEQQQLIEAQRTELQRQGHQLEVQFQRTASIQAELDALKAAMDRLVEHSFHPVQDEPSDGNGRRGRHPKNLEANSASDDA